MCSNEQLCLLPEKFQDVRPRSPRPVPLDLRLAEILIGVPQQIERVQRTRVVGGDRDLLDGINGLDEVGAAFESVGEERGRELLRRVDGSIIALWSANGMWHKKWRSLL